MPNGKWQPNSISRKPATAVLVQVFLRKLVRGVFAFPVDGEYPPAAPVKEELKTVDAASERLFPLGVARLIGAPDMSHVVPLFGTVRHRRLEEALAGEGIFAAGHIILGGENSGGDVAFVVAAAGDETSPRVEKRLEALPVARRAGRPGDNVIDRRQNVIDRIDVRGTRHRCARRWSLLIRILCEADRASHKKI